MKRAVFISHSSADKSVADEVCAYLERNGVPCWIAPRDVTPGKNYGAAIVDAIDECDLFVLILSHESNRSGQVAREVERAASNNDVIIPFRIESVQPSRNLEFYVSSAHWLDAVKKPTSEHFDQLLSAIHNWQKTEGGVEQAAIPPPVPVTTVAPPPPTVPRSPRWLPLAAAVAVVVLILGGWFLYQRFGVGQLETKTPLVSSPEPTATASPEVSAPKFTAAPAESVIPETTAAPTETPFATMTPAIVRRRPGEPLRSPGTNESATPSAGSARLRPGQGSAYPSPAESAAPPTPPAPSGPIVREIAASSQLNNEYRPSLAFDGNSATAWVPKGKGIGQSLFVHFKSPALIRSVSILNGDGRDEEHYKQSNRVKTLRIVLSDGTNQVFTFQDEMKMQHFKLAKPVTADWAKFEIISVFPGSKFSRSGISEIAFNEEP